MPVIDLSDFSESELSDLIEDASNRRDELRESRERETATGPFGSTGQDVRDPGHGAIPVPTPNEVKDAGPNHGVNQTAGVDRV